MQNIRIKSVLSYFILPRVIPRARRLFASGFGYIAFLMATIYGSVRLLPAGHPYLDPRNMNRFGIRHVIAEAANNLVIKRENIDQIIVFVALMGGALLLILQIFLLAYTYVIHPYFITAAMALPTGLFDTPNPVSSTPATALTDIAFVLLDNVFGVPGVFCNSNDLCTDVLGTGNRASQAPQAFHVALHELFRFYSTGILIVAVFIFLYFMVVVVVETAQTGTPFGQRFQNGWVPIRLIVALLMLIPFNYGLNGGQFIALYAAKLGSGFATNGWLVFNRTLGASGVTAKNPTGEDKSLLALPTAPDVTPVVMSMAMVHACAYAQWFMDTTQKKFDPATYPPPPHENFYVRPYFVKNPKSWMKNQETHRLVTPTTTYEEALEFYDNANIVIRFGIKDPKKYGTQPGDVGDVCGSVVSPTSDVSHVGEWRTMGGADGMQWFKFNMMRDMWYNPALTVFGEANSQLIGMTHRFMAISMRDKWNGTSGRPLQCEAGCDFNLLPSCTPTLTGDYRTAPCYRGKIKAEARQHIINNYQAEMNLQVLENWDMYNKVTTEFDMTDEILDLGWGGAGLWYNKINQINGGFISAVVDIPAPLSLPAVMEQVQKIRMEHSPLTATEDIFSPSLPDGKKIEDFGMDPLDVTRAVGMNDYFKWWNDDSANQADTGKVVSGSEFRDVMNMMFGTNNLFAMRGRNSHVHPLAQLSALGKGLIDSAVRNVGLSIFAAAMGGPAKVINPRVGTAIDAMSGFLVTTAFVGLTAGFILFYILPFMPFLYFFFAVGEWVKSIFEAMVGVPLWALAHLRIDGEGLPGDSASNGYFLILEIAIRPILIVIGLVAAMIIFVAQVRVLNMIWLLVLDNLTGFASKADVTLEVLFQFEVNRDIIDQFFFTVIYAIIIHMIATAAFKLIDSIPDNILRWAGSGASSFSDIAKSDPIPDLQRYAVMGGITVGQQTTQSLQTAARGGGNILQALIDPRTGMPK